jgi:hypothetical protein
MKRETKEDIFYSTAVVILVLVMISLKQMGGI